MKPLVVVSVGLAVLLVASGVYLVLPKNADTGPNGLLWSIDRDSAYISANPDSVAYNINVQYNGNTVVLDNHTLRSIDRSGSELWSRNIGFMPNTTGMAERDYKYAALQDGTVLINEMGSTTDVCSLACIGTNGSVLWRTQFGAFQLNSFFQNPDGTYLVSYFNDTVDPTISFLGSNGTVYSTSTVSYELAFMQNDGIGHNFAYWNQGALIVLAHDGSVTRQITLPDGCTWTQVREDVEGRFLIAGYYSQWVNDRYEKQHNFLKAYGDSGNLTWQLVFQNDISDILATGDGGARVLLSNPGNDTAGLVDASGAVTKTWQLQDEGSAQVLLRQDGFLIANSSMIKLIGLDQQQSWSLKVNDTLQIDINAGVIALVRNDTIQAYRYGGL